MKSVTQTALRLAEVWLEAILIGLVILMATAVASASGFKVGNGDDGDDLEKAERVQSGILIETRAKAVELLKTMRVSSIEHLGQLLPEVEKSDLYFVQKDVGPKLADDHGMTVTADQKSVYARTFAEPHAATRFFPSAFLLSQEQLVQLHIHEGLHRALPAAVREDESAVSAITLSITGADSGFDRIRDVTDREVGAKLREIALRSGGDVRSAAGTAATTQTRIEPPDAELERPSSFSYTYRSFIKPKEENSYPIESLQSIESFLYPFGTGGKALGLGISASYLRTAERTFLGPLELSGRLRLLTYREFDVGLWGSFALNTLSDDEFQNSPLGRDVSTFGISARRDARYFYVENRLGVSPQGSTTQKIGKVKYQHDYGTLTSAEVCAGIKLKGFEFGGFVELLLSDHYRVTGGAFKYDSGRYSILAAGPEVAYAQDALRVAVSARFVVDHTQGVTLDYTGDLMGRGVGQGSVQSSLSLRF